MIVSMDVRSSTFELPATFCDILALIKESQCTSIGSQRHRQKCIPLLPGGEFPGGKYISLEKKS